MNLPLIGEFHLRGNNALKKTETVKNDRYILSTHDEVTKEPNGDKYWDNYSRLQQFAEQQQRENQSLKQEIERVKHELSKTKEPRGKQDCDINLNEGRFTIKELKSRGFEIDDLVVTNKKIKDYSSNDILSKKPETIREEIFDMIEGPFVVQKGTIKLSEKTLNETFENMDELKKNNVKDLKVSYRDNKFRVDGKYVKLLPIPFGLEYSLGFNDGKLNVTLDDMKVIFPLPNFVEKIILNALGKHFAKGLIEQDKEKKENFSINVGAMLPFGFKADIKEIKSENGDLKIELGPPAENKE